MMHVWPKREVSERDEYIEALHQAHKEYNIALSAFTEAVEPELIDQAIFLMAAARRKYSYLLKKVKEHTPTPLAAE